METNEVIVEVLEDESEMENDENEGEMVKEDV
jgi:hypothetical protein